jgi:PIN domain nuclease of toxin-antitoxin system
MRLILDTHILIWLLEGNSQLSSQARLLIEDETNELLVSIASLWEIAIKCNLGRLNIGMPFEAFLQQKVDPEEFQILPIQPEHLVEVARLPLHHRDPFDRLLIAQAIAENLSIVSADGMFDAYPIKRCG